MILDKSSILRTENFKCSCSKLTGKQEIQLDGKYMNHMRKHSNKKKNRSISIFSKYMKYMTSGRPGPLRKDQTNSLKQCQTSSEEKIKGNTMTNEKCDTRKKVEQVNIS